jgi:hypothetical protein
VDTRTVTHDTEMLARNRGGGEGRWDAVKFVFGWVGRHLGCSRSKSLRGLKQGFINAPVAPAGGWVHSCYANQQGVHGLMPEQRRFRRRDRRDLRLDGRSDTMKR